MSKKITFQEKMNAYQITVLDRSTNKSATRTVYIMNHIEPKLFLEGILNYQLVKK